MTLPTIVAHRGNRSVTPENTLAAFASAIAAGCEGIEMDVVLSADGIPMVIHDLTVDGTTNASGRVAQFTVEQLQNFDAGSWFDPAFAGLRIPTFAQFAEQMSRHPSIHILLEFKDEWSPEQVRMVSTTVDQFGLVERSMLQSFHPTTIESIFTVAPSWRRGVLIEREPELLIERAAAAGIYTINPSVDYLFAHPDLAERIHDAGMKTQVWTANTPQQWERLVDMGVDAIITDRPDALAGWYAGKGLR